VSFWVLDIIDEFKKTMHQYTQRLTPLEKLDVDVTTPTV
jgi:hypothetical protein